MLALLFNVNQVYTQVFYGAVALGGNLTRLNGDEADAGITYNKIGVNFGLAAILPFGKNKNWDITLETTFTQKGSKQGDKILNDDYPWSYNLRLNYVEVPLLIHYNDKNFIKGGLGLSWGRLVLDPKEVEDNGDTRAYSDTHPFKKDDYSAVVDVMIRIWKKLHLNVRYSHSFISIRTRYFTYPATNPPEVDNDEVNVWDREQYNRVITVRFVYIINEKL